MTDEQIAEIYALAREAFSGGQKAFQIQAYPFRMTPLNMARHRNSPHIAFWKMLKQGYDHFEVAHLPSKVDVCEKRYVFNAESSGEFRPAERCPVYKVADEIAVAVRDKQRHDDFQTAELINRGTPVAPIRTGGQGGMNRTFLAAISQSGPGTTIRTDSGTIPPYVHPPTGTTAEETLNTTSTEPSSGARSSMPTTSAVAASSGEIGRFLSWFQSKDSENTPGSR